MSEKNERINEKQLQQKWLPGSSHIVCDWRRPKYSKATLLIMRHNAENSNQLTPAPLPQQSLPRLFSVFWSLPRVWLLLWAKSVWD